MIFRPVDRIARAGYLSVMTFKFEQAYRRLHPSEREFVDGFVAWLEQTAIASKDTLCNVLARPLPPLDQRTVAFLQREIVATAIGDRARDIDESNRLTEYKTLRSLQNIAQGNLADFMEFDTLGQPEWKLHLATPDQVEAIKSVEFDERSTPQGFYRKIKVTLHDKLKALEIIAKYQGLLQDEGETWKRREAERIAADKSVPTLAADVTDDEASDAYARLLEGPRG